MKGLVAAGVLLCVSSAVAADVVMNGSFERPQVRPERPPYWFEGLSDSPSSYSANGSWALEPRPGFMDRFALRMSPASPGGYVFSQVLHAPAHALKGKAVTVSADIRRRGLDEPPAVVLLAYNPELPPDPLFGVGLAGWAFIAATGPEDSWQSYTAGFVASDDAAGILLVLHTAGTSGAAWFDNVTVEMDVPSPGPDPAPRTSPLAERRFRLGFVGDIPQDFSEKAEEELAAKAAANAEALNLFFTVRWTSLTGEPIAEGHRQKLRMASLARAAGLPLVLTFNFTHFNAEAIGHLVPAPDGQPPPGVSPFDLGQPRVREAVREELLTLAAIVGPRWVMIGVEMDIFHDLHPDQWDDFLALYKECYAALKARRPNLVIGTYFTLPWMVSGDGVLDRSHAAEWRRLLPELDFIGYSAYPGTMPGQPAAPPTGYYLKAGEVAPDLPLIIPEFGLPGGEGAALPASIQAYLLEGIFSELSAANVILVSWYHMFDFRYLGAPEWFEQAFSRIGLHDQAGTPKEAWAAWQAVHRVPSPFPSRPRPPQR